MQKDKPKTMFRLARKQSFKRGQVCGYNFIVYGWKA